MAVKVDFARLDSYEIRVFQDLGGAELRAAIELVSPANKDRAGKPATFAAKCAGYLKHGIGVVIVDVVTSRTANLHEELFDVLEVKGRRAAWASPTGPVRGGLPGRDGPQESPRGGVAGAAGSGRNAAGGPAMAVSRAVRPIAARRQLPCRLSVAADSGLTAQWAPRRQSRSRV